MTDLEILLVTYNRAAELRGTLTALSEGPFGDHPITILDNASTDATPEVCAHFAERLEHLRVVRHQRNIGAGANYLRAVELSRGRYTWILADDDDLDFSAVDDVLSVMSEGAADLISVGAPGRRPDQAGSTTSARRMFASGGRYFWIFTFIPNTIFRTDLFDDRSLEQGYYRIGSFYPQFEFLRRQLERDASVYLSKREIVSRRGLTTPLSELVWFTSWVQNCATLDSEVWRRRAIFEVSERRRDLVVYVAGAIAAERLDHPARSWRLLGSLLADTHGIQRAAVLVLCALAFVPKALLLRARTVARRRAGITESAAGEHFTSTL